MKGFYQIFFLILCFCITTYQTTAQNDTQSERNVKGQNPSEGILNEQEVINKFKKTMVQVKSLWILIDPATKTEVYHLYIPVKTLAKAGIKVSQPLITADAKAVPVYVKTANGGYEPLLTTTKGNPETPVGLMSSSTGSIVTSDGFILTTRSAITGWKETFIFAKEIPRGITMSADLKQVVDTNTAPPTDWVPVNTKSRNGKLGNFNIQVKSADRYDGRNERLDVQRLDDTRSIEAQLVSTSARSNIGIIKIKAPENLKKTELLDNYDKLGKGEKLYMIYADPLTTSPDLNLKVSPLSVTDFLRTDAAGDFISMADDFENSTTASKEQKDLRRLLFDAYINWGMPIYNNRGQVVGIYSHYKADTNQHYIVPIKYGVALFQNQ